MPKVQDNSSQKSVWASVSKVARSSLQDSNDYSAATLSSVNQDIFSSQVSKLHANIFDNEQGNSLLGKQSKSNSWKLIIQKPDAVEYKVTENKDKNII